jgi:ribosomal-protein-alanine N-acetyltransferase
VNAAGPVTVRAAIAADLDDVYAIETSSFSMPWRRESFRDVLLGAAADFRVAVRAGRVVGYTIVIVAADEAELASIAVVPAARRAGIARLLLDAVCTSLDRRGVARTFLEVRESNVAALALYRAFGFAEIARRRRYYRLPDEDAVVMRRDRPAEN